MEEKTLVFFFSDNGGPVMQGTSVNGSRNDPLRGSKRTTLEGGVRVPFVVSWKGRIPAGKVYENPVAQIDIAPTIYAAAGVEPKADWGLEGADLMPYLLGSKPGIPHDALCWRFGQMMAIRQGDWKLVKYDATPAKLYNLSKDIGESKDLTASESERDRAMQAEWERWNSRNVAPLWGGQGARARRNRNRIPPAVF